MKINKFLILVIFITAISLAYVHQEMELVKFSYKVQSSQKTLDGLLDQNRLLEYNVIALETPVNIERQLKANRIELVLPKREQVVGLRDSGIEGIINNETKHAPLYAFFKFLTGVREAQAKPPAAK